MKMQRAIGLGLVSAVMAFAISVAATPVSAHGGSVLLAQTNTNAPANTNEPDNTNEPTSTNTSTTTTTVNETTTVVSDTTSYSWWPWALIGLILVVVLVVALVSRSGDTHTDVHHHV